MDGSREGDEVAVQNGDSRLSCCTSLMLPCHENANNYLWLPLTGILLQLIDGSKLFWYKEDGLALNLFKHFRSGIVLTFPFVTKKILEKSQRIPSTKRPLLLPLYAVDAESLTVSDRSGSSWTEKGNYRNLFRSQLTNLTHICFFHLHPLCCSGYFHRKISFYKKQVFSA